MTFTRKLASAGSVLALTAAGLVAAAAPASAAYTPEEFDELDPTTLNMVWAWDMTAETPDCLGLGYPGVASGFDFVPVSLQPNHFNMEFCLDDLMLPGVRLTPREGAQVYDAAYSVTYKWVNPSDPSEEHYRTRSVFPLAEGLAAPIDLTGSWASQLIDLSAFDEELDEGETLIEAFAPEFGDTSALAYWSTGGPTMTPVYVIPDAATWRVAHESGVQVNVRTSNNRWLVGKVRLDFPHAANEPLLVEVPAGSFSEVYVPGLLSGWDVATEGLPEGVTSEVASMNTLRFYADAGLGDRSAVGSIRYLDPEHPGNSITRTLGVAVVGDSTGGGDSEVVQADPFTLSGRVVDSKGKGVANAMVVVEYLYKTEGHDYGDGYLITTGKSGAYSFTVSREGGGVMDYRVRVYATYNGVKLTAKTVSGTAEDSLVEVNSTHRLATHKRVTLKGNAKAKAKTKFQIVSNYTGKVVAKGKIAKGKRSKAVTVPVGTHTIHVQGAPKVRNVTVKKDRSVKVVTKPRAIRTKITVRVPKRLAKSGKIRVQDAHGYVIGSKTLSKKSIKRAKGKYVKVKVTVRGAGKFSVSAVKGKGSKAKTYAVKTVKVSAKSSTKRVGKKSVTLRASKYAPKVRK